MKVTLGLIMSHGFPVPAPFVVGLAGLLRVIMTGVGNETGLPDDAIDTSNIIFSHAFPIDTARNEIVRIFLDHDDSDYLLFLDTDMRHPSDLAHRLVRRRRDIVTARYHTRRPPFFPVAMRKVGDGPNDYQSVSKVVDHVQGLMPIDAAGAGALLIKRRVLIAIRERIGDDWFKYQTGPNGLRSVSEDMWFFEQAKAAGFQAYLDADLECAHISQVEVTGDWHAPYLEKYKEAIA